MKMSIATFLILLLIGLAAGALSGVAGVGGGVIVIPALIFALGMSQFEAQGTSLAMMIPPIGLMAAYNYYEKGFIDWKYALILAVFFVIGSYFGSKFALGTSQALIKKGFAIFIIIIGIKMLWSK
jgi:uncharacterized membrane protein YfcA